MQGLRAIWIAAFVAYAATVGRSEESATAPSLAAKAPWVRFDVISGRLVALQSRFNQTKTLVSEDPSSGVHESISLSAKQQRTCLAYQRTCPRQSLTVDFVNGDTVELRCVPRGESTAPTVHLNQDRQRGLVLTVGEKPHEQQCQASSIWHLLLAEPDVCRQHVVPALQRLRPDWRLVEASESIKSELLTAATLQDPPGRDEIARLVEQLGSYEQPTRRLADRELRSLGQVAVGYLRHLDQDMLNAEQRLRTRRILQSLKSPIPDTPPRVAQRLVGDPQIWTTLLAANDATIRSIAVSHLENICARSIDVELRGNRGQRRTEVERVSRRSVLIVK